jgi:hypothetical protein
MVFTPILSPPKEEIPYPVFKTLFMSKLVEDKTHGKTRHLTIFLSNVISLDLGMGNSSI